MTPHTPALRALRLGRASLVIALFFAACTLPPDEDTGTTPTGPAAPGGGTPGATARVATLDSISFPALPTGAALNPLEQWETNAGLYFLVSDPATISGAPTTVFRYNPGAAGSFQTTTITGFASSIRPSNQYTEGASVIALLYAGLEAFGQKNVNNGFPDSRTVQRADQDIQILIPDRSSTGRNWAVADINNVMVIARQSAVLSQGFTRIATPIFATLPFRGITTTSGTLYFGSGTRVYAITSSGIARTFDLSAIASGQINKLVVTPDDRTVLVGYGSRVLAIDAASSSATPSPVATVGGIASVGTVLGNFCYSSGHVYTSDGMRTTVQGSSSSFVQSSGTVATADASRLVRIRSILVSGQALCLMASTSINPAVYIQSGKYLYRIGSITP